MAVEAAVFVTTTIFQGGGWRGEREKSSGGGQVWEGGEAGGRAEPAGGHQSSAAGPPTGGRAGKCPSESIYLFRDVS